MPAVSNVALASGTWLTADEGAALFDGRPSRAARISRSGTVTITVTLATAIVPGVVALLGLNVPPGTAITAAGASGVTFALADGSVACYLLPSGSTPTTSVAITVAGTGTLQIGEIAIMRRTETKITHDFGVQRIDTKASERDRGSQLATRTGESYRRLRTTLSLADDSAVRGGGLPGATDWDRLEVLLVNDQRCIAIPRRNVGGTFNAELMHRTAIYGVASEIGETQHVRGPWYSKGLVFDELPC